MDQTELHRWSTLLSKSGRKAGAFLVQDAYLTVQAIKFLSP